MIIQAAMYCMAEDMADFNDRMKTFWLGSLNSMIKGPPNVQIAVALGAMGQINSLMQQLQHEECPEHAKLDIRNLVFMLTSFLETPQPTRRVLTMGSTSSCDRSSISSVQMPHR